MLARARLQAAAHFPVVKEEEAEEKGLKGRESSTAWTGAFNKSATQFCHAFAFGKLHMANQLDNQGKCKFLHACDRWVTGGGKAAVCGSVKHGRMACDNPLKSDTAEP
jgi:hypothetical protein